MPYPTRQRTLKAMDWRTRITMDPAVLVGKPVVRGTRLSVEFVVELLANGWTTAQIVAEYPGVQQEDVQACLAYAAEALQGEGVYPIPAE
jgi:uncharacterized protein (DUF433 family)